MHKEGFSYGFHISFMGPQIATYCDNLKSARDLSDVVMQKVASLNYIHQYYKRI